MVIVHLGTLILYRYKQIKVQGCLFCDTSKMLGQDCRRKYCRPRDQGQSARGQQCFLFAGAFDSYSGQSDRFDVFSSVVADT